MERILLSSKKTGLHDDVLRILFLHMDPILPLPRLRMLSVTSNFYFGIWSSRCFVFVLCLLFFLFCVPIFVAISSVLYTTGSLSCSWFCSCLSSIYRSSIKRVVFGSTAKWSGTCMSCVYVIVSALFDSKSHEVSFYDFYRLFMEFMPKMFM